MNAHVRSPARAAKISFDEQWIEGSSANDGPVEGTLSGMPVLILTTTGVGTGQTRTTTATYSRDFSRLIIVAAPHGSRTHSDWHHDIVADPNVTVEVDGERFKAVARVTTNAERHRLFEQMAPERLSFVESQFGPSRQLPVIVLERVLDKTTDYNAFNSTLIEEFHARGGKVGGIFEGLPLLLLNTTGAKSGEPRIAPLVYGVDGERLVVVASKGGSPTNPDWYHNVMADPTVSVDVGTEAFPARATVVGGSERQHLFNRLVEVTPQLAETQASTTRQFPVIMLERGLARDARPQ